MKNELEGLVTAKPTTVSKKSLRDVLFQYLAYWPLFLISIVLFLAGAYAYLRYTIPLYSANTIINVKGETTTGRGSQQTGDLITTAMQGGKSVINLDNELGRLRSVRLMTLVVRSSDLNISYYREGTITTNDIYHAAPFRLLQKEIQDSSRSLSLSIAKLSPAGFTLSYGDEDNPTVKTVPWNQDFTVNGNTYQLTPLGGGMSAVEKYITVWNPIQITVYELLPKVAVNVIGKTNNIALGITIENAERGEEVLNRMVIVFKAMNLEDQNRAAKDREFFINERLVSLSKDLEVSEKDLANAKGKNLMAGDGGGIVMGQSVGAASIGIDELNVQRSALASARATLLNGGASTTLPLGGISDGGAAGMISAYNQLVMERTAKAQQLAPGSLILQDVDNRIANMRTGVLGSISSAIRNLDAQASTLAKQSGQYSASVGQLPEVQRVVNSMTRQTKITEQLYVYLLQEREKTQLSRSTIDNSPYEQIDLATSYGPVSPNRKNTFIFASILGLIVPIVIIILLGMINDKVSARAEIENAVSAQIVGEIGNVKRSEDKLIPAMRGGIIGEQFRIMRANFNFLQKASEVQSILVTSSVSGEGKSFISLNLAAVIAKTGKRVALLEFDLRKPPESPLPIFHGRGLKDYLMGEATLDEIGQPIGELPSLYVFPTGEIVSEAGDLIVNDRMPQLFAELKERFDAIVINTPPVGLVGDALVLQKYSNIVGYVVRQNFTRKRQLAFFNSLVETNKFNNAAIIFNGVRTGTKYGYYGYGYAEKNAYFDRDGNSKATGRLFKKRKKESATT